METRREFCVQVCRAASFAAVGVALQSCSGGPTSPSGSMATLPTASATVSNGIITVSVDAASPLASVGGAALIQTTLGSFLATRTAQDAFIVLTAECTHAACTITDFSNAHYVCPCHLSEFATDGTVTLGPAMVALRRFANQFANNVLTFTP